MTFCLGPYFQVQAPLAEGVSIRHLAPAGSLRPQPLPPRRCVLKKGTQRVQRGREKQLSQMSRLTADSGQILDQATAETNEPVEQTTNAEVVFKGRNVEVPDHYRIYVSQKLARLERFDRSIYLFDVELKHAPNRRQRKSCQRVEITARGRGPVSRAEACANSFYAAFESAVDKLESRLRRVKDRRKVHYGDKTPVSLAAATAVAQLPENSVSADAEPEPQQYDGAGPDRQEREDHAPGRVVRIKEHQAKPMTVDDALYEMELVGHDFFLFYDKQTERPSVVYRRHAYDYGLISLS
jgi:ribosomal subunit interface protein